MKNQKEQWEESFQRKNNFVFYPHEEVIRFFSKYIVKRTGLDSFEKIVEITGTLPKVLDLGCGVGRHVIYANEMQTDAYGIDLSESAVEIARDWAKRKNIKDVNKRILQGDITNMPFENNFFDFIISHGVLDSMSLINSTNSAKEAARVLKPGGLFYCDLVCGDDSLHPAGFSGEEIVTSEHEKGTIQLYFNTKLMDTVFGEHFLIAENILVRRESLISKHYLSRYHIVFKKK